MNIDSKSVANELAGLRAKQHKTLKEAAEGIGIHHNTLANYEKDASKMSLDLLEKILKFYEVDELIFFRNIREYNHN